MKYWKRALALLLSGLLAATLLAACSGGNTDESPAPTAGDAAGEAEESAALSQAAASGEEVVITFPSFQVGVNPSAPVVSALVEGFNTEYAGKYRIEVEEIPGDANYVEKMKVLLSSDQLPDVVYAGGHNLLDMALSRDAVVDLTPYLDADPEWKALFDERTLETNSRDGKVYSLPSEKSVIGYFYNKELFAQAGITETAKTWDELYEQCDKLLAAGITPMSLDTADSGWASSLWLGAFVATSGAEGQAFMDELMPDDYSTPYFVESVEKLKYLLQNYTTDDAIGGKFEHAANNFLSGRTAILANGPWMVGQFSDPDKAPEGFDEKVGVAIYPEGYAYNAPMLGYFVAAKDDAHIEASVEMVKYFTSAGAQEIALDVAGLLPASSAVEFTPEMQEKYPYTVSLLEQAKDAEIETNYLQATMYPNLLDIFSQELPSLVADEITAQEFCDRLTEGAARNQ